MIVAFPHRPGIGGPGSFQQRLERQFSRQGWRTIYLSESPENPDIVVVIGGTRRLLRLIALRFRRVPVIYRLDGILWMHRQIWPGLRKFIIDESRNLLMKITHGFLNDHVIYQSEFVRTWWERSGWRRQTSYSVIRNGADVQEFSPRSDHTDRLSVQTNRKVICVEGTIDYSPYAVQLLRKLSRRLGRDGISIEVYGGFANRKSRTDLEDHVNYRGVVSRSEVASAYSGGVYLSLDVHAACPNTVIEAMCSGLPVVGFDTGALSELVPVDCGKVVDFGSDPWQLGFPDIEALANAIVEVIEDYAWYSTNALRHAHREFRIERVSTEYAQLIGTMIGNKRNED